MMYLIKYIDCVAPHKAKEYIEKTLEVKDFTTLADAISLLQQNKNLILSVTLFNELLENK